MIGRAFDRYRLEFTTITARAPDRFARREWREVHEDATLRLDLYRRSIDRLEEEIADELGARVRDRAVWVEMKRLYSAGSTERADRELAETFFNSITRRLFSTVGVDSQCEFVARQVEPQEPSGGARDAAGFDGDLHRVVGRVLDTGLGVVWEDRERDVGLVVDRVRPLLEGDREIRVEMSPHPFYRGAGAYLVGRVESRSRPGFPLVLAVRNGSAGAWVDAVLLEERDVSILFSYTRSYFHVVVERPDRLVAFLKQIIPRKRTAELYIAIGFDKHGKTELYRDLIDHLASTDDVFEPTPGTPGMVMASFGLPSQDLVLKVIRDRFPPPKQTTRRVVMERYRLVSRHDRAGRLIDAWEFEHLVFDRSRFSAAVLDDLSRTAARTVDIGADTVVVHHAYVERGVTPLNVFVRTQPFEEGALALLDMGSAVKDLALSGIFPGDMLLKNFGVTRSGRVVFYDYDELALLSSINFRWLPVPIHPEDELSSDPWWGVGDGDVFPEELPAFLGVPPRLREHFMATHADLYDPGTWRSIQNRLAAGEIIEIPPYAPERRLRRCRPPFDVESRDVRDLESDIESPMSGIGDGNENLRPDT